MGQATAIGQVPAGAATILSERLLLSIAEQLKVPFMQIARSAELIGLGKLRTAQFSEPDEDFAHGLREIQLTADMALSLLDNYLFGARLALEEQYRLSMEPVSVAGVLYDSAAALQETARMYGVDLDLHIGGKFGPVMANRQALQSALVSLGYALIEALPNLQDRRLRLQLAAHRCRYGIVAGLYSETEQLTVEALRVGQHLQGHARQPLPTLTHTAGAGIFVAGSILQAMQTELKPSRHHRLYGLGVVLHANPQLQLV